MSPEQSRQIQRRIAAIAEERAEAPKPALVANRPPVANKSVANKSQAGRDPEKRKAYMRDLMRAKRAKK